MVTRGAGPVRFSLQREGLRVGGCWPRSDLFRAPVPTSCHRLTLLFPTVAAAPSPDSCSASCPCVLRHVRGCGGSRPAPPHRGSPAATRPFLARPVVVRNDLHPVPGQHSADRLDSEPFLVVIDERDYHGKRGSSVLDPLRIRRRRPTAPTRIDIGLLHPRAQRVRIHPDPRPDPHHLAVHGQLVILIADFLGPSGSPTHATQPHISAVLAGRPLSVASDQ
jgi:hypothetical protein